MIRGDHRAHGRSPCHAEEDIGRQGLASGIVPERHRVGMEGRRIVRLGRVVLRHDPEHGSHAGGRDRGPPQRDGQHLAPSLRRGGGDEVRTRPALRRHERELARRVARGCSLRLRIAFANDLCRCAAASASASACALRTCSARGSNTSAIRGLVAGGSESSGFSWSARRKWDSARSRSPTLYRHSPL